MILAILFMSTRSKGRPKHRWEDDVKGDVANMKITGRTASETDPNGKNSLRRSKLL